MIGFSLPIRASFQRLLHYFSPHDQEKKQTKPSLLSLQKQHFQQSPVPYSGDEFLRVLSFFGVLIQHLFSS
nr:MAG TPA: hypothetical protein [Bacteriophage sp.]